MTYLGTAEKHDRGPFYWLGDMLDQDLRGLVCFMYDVWNYRICTTSVIALWETNFDEGAETGPFS